MNRTFEEKKLEMERDAASQGEKIRAECEEATKQRLEALEKQIRDETTRKIERIVSELDKCKALLLERNSEIKILVATIEKQKRELEEKSLVLENVSKMLKPKN